MRKKVGVSADDITGANDIGIMFAKNGYAAGIFPYYNQLDATQAGDLDVVIIDTNSRFDKPKIAYGKVFDATKKLMELNCDLYIKKPCSVFRGNIGAEFDAMQQALGVRNSMVVLGFPKNGRTTINGLHHVNGILLENSQFRNDPVNPMTESDLVKILSGQTDKKVVGLKFDLFDESIDVIKDRIRSLKKDYSYIVFDVRDQRDLRIIAEAIKDEKNICGSSAIAEELPVVWNKVAFHAPANKHLLHDRKGVLIVAGSLTSQTFIQVECLKKLGYRFIEFDTGCIYKPQELKQTINNIIKQASNDISGRVDVLIYTSNNKIAVEETKTAGHRAGMDDGEIGKMISSALSEITSGIEKNTGFRKLIVAGGDTSASICKKLGIKKMVVIDEIEPGLPDMYGYTDNDEFLVILKSGSFGSELFLKKAVERLRTLAED